MAATSRVDLSSSSQGAGGIGGLLARSQSSAPTAQDAFYFCDGNGNVTAMVNTNQLVVAKYSYDPFGNVQVSSGPLAEANLYRFSSKEAHGNSGLDYYGYRYYAPGLQRWVNRDPLLQMENLYSYVKNCPIDFRDPFGLSDSEGCFDDCYRKFLMERIRLIARLTGNNAPSLGTGVIMTGLDFVIMPVAIASGGTLFVVYLGYSAITGALDYYAARKVLEGGQEIKRIVNGDFARCLNGCRKKCPNNDQEAKDFFEQFKWH